VSSSFVTGKGGSGSRQVLVAEVVSKWNAEGNGPGTVPSEDSPEKGSPSRCARRARWLSWLRFFDLDPRRIKRYFREEDGTLRVAIAPWRLGTTTSEQVRSLALVLVTARQMAYDEGPTPVSVVREECERHGILNTNFAGYMSTLDRFLIVEGSRHHRTYRLRPRAQEQAKRIVASVG
jgi:hypothetical protein